jgi:DNA-binding CsgD family transcriptional regulator
MRWVGFITRAKDMTKQNSVDLHLDSIELPDTIKTKITARETEVLLLVLSKITSDEIARRLGISAGTVKKHRERINERLNVNSIKQIKILITDRSCLKQEINTVRKSA